jgi:hypothetical protein
VAQEPPRVGEEVAGEAHVFQLVELGGARRRRAVRPAVRASNAYSRAPG